VKGMRLRGMAVGASGSLTVFPADLRLSVVRSLMFVVFQIFFFFLSFEMEKGGG